MTHLMFNVMTKLKLGWTLHVTAENLWLQLGREGRRLPVLRLTFNGLRRRGYLSSRGDQMRGSVLVESFWISKKGKDEYDAQWA